MRSIKGFTLVELLVTIAVLAIALSIAVPGFTDLLRQNRAQTHAGVLVNALSLARSEAVKSGGLAGARAKSGTDWRDGWDVWADTNDNETFDNDEVLRTFPALPDGISLTSGAGDVVFAASGVRHPAGGNSEISFEYKMDNLGCQYERLIAVNPMGRVSISAKVCP